VNISLTAAFDIGSETLFPWAGYVLSPTFNDSNKLKSYIPHNSRRVYQIHPSKITAKTNNGILQIEIPKKAPLDDKNRIEIESKYQLFFLGCVFSF
jgi:hypothetical protein